MPTNSRTKSVAECVTLMATLTALAALSIDMVLPALKAANPKSHEFKAKAKVLFDLLEHHIKEEETQMFKEARELFGDLVRRNAIVRGFELRMRNEMGMADGDAAGDAHAMQS